MHRGLRLLSGVACSSSGSAAAARQGGGSAAGRDGLSLRAGRVQTPRLQRAPAQQCRALASACRGGRSSSSTIGGAVGATRQPRPAAPAPACANPFGSGLLAAAFGRARPHAKLAAAAAPGASSGGGGGAGGYSSSSSGGAGPTGSAKGTSAGSGGGISTTPGSSNLATTPGARGAAGPPQQQHHQQPPQQPQAAALHPTAGADANGWAPKHPAMPLQQFEVSLEEVIHSRYLTLYNRRVRFSAPGQDPSQAREMAFDVIGHPNSDYQFAVTFPFHPYKDGRRGGEVTVIREYAQGPNCLMYCLPTGGFDKRKHEDLLACAKAELSEEALLAGGRWVPLLPPGHPGLSEVKWCMNRFRPFLVIDPGPDLSPGSRDLEEVSMEVVRMPLDEFRSLMLGGDMLLPSITASYMALDRLREEGLL